MRSDIRNAPRVDWTGRGAGGHRGDNRGAPARNFDSTMEEGGAAVDQAAAGSGILVTKRPVEVLAGPSSSASVLYGFPAGRPFRLIGRDAGFAKIQDLKSSATGWIDETALAQPSPSEAASAPSAATASIKQDAGTLTPEQSPVQKPGRPKGRQGPLSGFLGGLFGARLAEALIFPPRSPLVSSKVSLAFSARFSD